RTASTSSAISRSLSSPTRTLSRIRSSSASWQGNRTQCRERRSSIAELLEVFVGRAGQQIEERVEAAIESAAELWDRAVEGVEREPGRRSVRELQRRLVDAFQCALGNQSDAVDERVASHDAILSAFDQPARAVDRVVEGGHRAVQLLLVH